MTIADQTLDVRGLACPLPVLRAGKVLRGLAGGDRLTVRATDPAAPEDFRAFCATTGHVLLSADAGDGQFTIVIAKRDG